MTTEIRQTLTRYLRVWHRCATGWQVLYLLLGISATISSLIVTTFAGELGMFWIRVTAFVAAFSVGLTTTMDLQNRHRRYRAAWRHLNTACLLFQAGKCPEEYLVKAYTDAEAMIGHFEVASPSVKS